MGGGALQGILGGGAMAMPGAAEAMSNPMMTGLMGGAGADMLKGGGTPGGMPGGGGMPPMPVRNPMFSDPAGDARGAKLIKEQPGMASLFAEAMAKPRGSSPITGSNSTPAVMGGDSIGSFESRPWSSETVMGKDVTGTGWKPSRGNITLPEKAEPLPVTTPNAGPSVPPRNPMFSGPVGTPSAAPQPPQGAQAGQQAAGPAKPNGLFGINIPGIETVQQKFKETPTNPMFQAGMGLLASGYDGSNPYTNVASNLRGIQPHEIALRSMGIKEAEEGREKKKQSEIESDAQLRQLIAQMMMSGMGAPGAAGPQGAQAAQAQGQARLVR